jgi:2-phosphosulfolactate phosphatase
LQPINRAWYSLRFDWALQGADAIALDSDVAVVIDVLSFTTTLTVALDRGATVLPYRWKDNAAADYARRNNAVLAVDRADAGSGDISLSPGTLRTSQPPERLVLPSPNGSTIAHHLGEHATAVLGASLRNATAVAQWISDHNDPATSSVSVIAAVNAGRMVLFDPPSKTYVEPAPSSQPCEAGAGPRAHRKPGPLRPHGHRLPST